MAVNVQIETFSGRNFCRPARGSALRRERAHQRRKLIDVDGCQLVAVASTNRLDGNEARVAELAQVVGDERLRQPGRGLELANGTACAGKPENDQKPIVVGERSQDGHPTLSEPPTLLDLTEVDSRGWRRNTHKQISMITRVIVTLQV
jgi:hypothetical protein